ncbi:MAG: hypothetical protein FWE03_06260 [Firmicutes bacterium]|nr:hypothetical protein [Bacillota bacterium]
MKKLIAAIFIILFSFTIFAGCSNEPDVVFFDQTVQSEQSQEGIFRLTNEGRAVWVQWWQNNTPRLPIINCGLPPTEMPNPRSALFVSISDSSFLIHYATNVFNFTVGDGHPFSLSIITLMLPFNRTGNVYTAQQDSYRVYFTFIDGIINARFNGIQNFGLIDFQFEYETISN